LEFVSPAASRQAVQPSANVNSQARGSFTASQLLPHPDCRLRNSSRSALAVKVAIRWTIGEQRLSKIVSKTGQVA